MDKCISCDSPAITNGMCESCIEGLLENYACTEVELKASNEQYKDRIKVLEAENMQRKALELDATAFIIALKAELVQAKAAEVRAVRDANNEKQKYIAY